MAAVLRMLAHLRAAPLPPRLHRRAATTHHVGLHHSHPRVCLTRAAGMVAMLGLLYEQTALMESPLVLNRQNTRLVPVQLRKRTTKADQQLLVSTSAVRGDRATMEDTLFVSPSHRFAAVFDGHGGAHVSRYLQAHLYDLVVSHLGPDQDTWSLDEIDARLRAAFKAADTAILARKEWREQGSTATAVFLIDDLIWSMNVGDSRAVLCRDGRALNLTRDHKPNDPEERQRIEDAGGKVRWHGLRDAAGKPVVDMGAYRINSNLAVARAFGDGDQRPYVCGNNCWYVSGEMELKCFRRDPKDKFIVLASDGLWDVFTSAEVVTFVKDVLSGEVGGRESWRSGSHADTSVELFEWRHKYKNDTSMIQAALTRRKEHMATYLTQEALYRGSVDNVAVAVVWLDKI
ncbi:Aste57867_15235 [Aphanomyces stellatus]|uniref:Aste57867_15235 protein n=1 Tax=Aphanomyces stellatus TaxID=120398 RepID=A0A485L3M8_9STRA|nr:hypothetical protein As57867_015179 [Aphanomyces stellatus]VFT92044.1 Aste57867_15235 [Aphanomyces stellatus]